MERSDDIEIAVALARLAHDELEAFGTAGGQQLDDGEMREVLLALRAVAGRVGLADFNIPFRDFTTFTGYWLREGAYGSWQAQRDLLGSIFDSSHDRLADLESRSLASTLVDPVSPRGRTGWSKIDGEIAELRRHFQSARSPQDYRNVGNDCVTVLEALSAQPYDPERHLRHGELEPHMGKTKQRLERFVEDGLPDAGNASLRRLVRASIDFAQELKHTDTSSRRDAGISADAVIQLANLLRRIDDGYRTT